MINPSILFKIGFGIALCLLSIAQSFAQVSQLNDYLKTAEENNPELKVIYNEYQASLEKIPQVGALADPQVSFGYFLQPVETRVGPQRVTVGVSQALPWFGTLKAQKTVEETKAKAEFEAYQDARLQLFYEVKEVYYQLYYLEKAEVITNENLELLNSMKSLTQVSFEAGKAALVDVLRLDMDIEDLKVKLESLKDAQQAAEIKFEKLLNSDLEESPFMPDTLWNEVVDDDKVDIQKQMIANSHRLKALDKKYEAYGHQQDAAEKMGMPGFTIGANYINVGKRTDMDVPNNGKDALLLPQIGFKIPINRKKYRSMVKEATFKREAVSAQIDNTTNQLITKMEMVYKDYQDALRNVELYSKQSDLAQRSLDLLQTAFTTDGKNFVEVLRMNQKLLNYQLQLEKARSNRNTKAAYINYLIAE